MPRLVLLNNFLLFLACSILLGAGLSHLTLGIPLEPEAPRIMGTLAIAMLATALAMLLSEWFTGIRWVPIVVLLALAGWAALPMTSIAPADQDRIRLALVAVQWAAMMYWFGRLAAQGRADR